MWLAVTYSVFPQKSIFVGDLTAGKPVDVTRVLESSSDRVIREKLGDRATLEIRFDSRSSSLVQKIGPNIQLALSRVIDIFSPQRAVAVKVYVARVEKVPRTFEVSFGDAQFVYPIVYDSGSDLDADCTKVTKICDTVFTAMPHELAH